jgi:Ribosomal protein L31
MERRGDYGYDAPYALVTFAAVGTACAIVAWRSRAGHLARIPAYTGVRKAANAEGRIARFRRRYHLREA